MGSPAIGWTIAARGSENFRDNTLELGKVAADRRTVRGDTGMNNSGGQAGVGVDGGFGGGGSEMRENMSGPDREGRGRRWESATVRAVMPAGGAWD